MYSWIRGLPLIPVSVPSEPIPELVAQLAQETYSTDLLLHLVNNLHRLEFESRKDVVQVFSHLLRRQIGSRFPTVEYLSTHHDVIFAAFKGYDNEEIGLNTGMILREMLKHEPLAKILLYSEQCVQFHPPLLSCATLTVSSPPHLRPTPDSTCSLTT